MTRGPALTSPWFALAVAGMGFVILLVPAFVVALLVGAG